jgi:hypothetical protein
MRSYVITRNDGAEVMVTGTDIDEALSRNGLTKEDIKCYFDATANYQS